MRLALSEILLCVVALASIGRAGVQEAIAENRWLARSQVLTSHLKDDAKKLDRVDRALLFARLGEAWWDTDKYQASSFFSEAIQQVTPSPEKESAAERSNRLSVARVLLPIIAPRDANLAATLTAIFLPAETEINRSNFEDAAALVEAASAILRTNPQRAYDLAGEALRLGASYRLAPLLWKMRRVNPKLSDNLFAACLVWARGSNDINFLSALSTFAFEGPSGSDNLRKAVLETVLSWIARPTTTPDEQAISCQVAPLAASAIRAFDRLMPYHAPMIRGMVMRCQRGGSEASTRRINEKLEGLAPNTVDELLKAAEASRNSREREEYLSRAAYLAFEERNFVRAIDILDSMSDEGRIALQGTWESWRGTFAGFAAVDAFKAGEHARMEKIIAATPAALRAWVELNIIEEMLRAKQQAAAIDMLQRARRDVVRSGQEEEVLWGMVLLRRYAQLLPGEAAEVFRDVVKAINQVKDFSPPTTGRLAEDQRNRVLANETLLKAYDLPSSLLESEETGTFDTTAAIVNPVIRAAVRANLLSNCLKQYRLTQRVNETAHSQERNNDNRFPAPADVTLKTHPDLPRSLFNSTAADLVGHPSQQ